MTGWKTSHTIALGLAAALGVSVGMQLGGGDRGADGPGGAEGFGVPPQLIDAATAQNFENFAVATGPVDGDIEAFYFLDFLTGSLKAVAINTRTGVFGSRYEYNIAADFDSAGAKNPKFLMVTGTARIPRGRGNTQIASSVVYITEATTGKMAAYIMPWNSSMQAAGKVQTGTFRKVAEVQLRNSFVRDQ
ncbi:MAG: hypothetical protein AAF790_04490 [Planctomycetota bacterium]